MAALTRMQETPTVQGLADALAVEVRGLTGFDRVMVYRFAADWTGVVIAESADAGMPTYRGLHFPAGDIPPQARRLYALNLLRLIPDRTYRPARLIPAENPRTADRPERLGAAERLAGASRVPGQHGRVGVDVDLAVVLRANSGGRRATGRRRPPAC
jgi:light-regulated signal transduction histidine kinase (bacteriophytochrome)